MRVRNNSKGVIMLGQYRLVPGAVTEVSDTTWKSFTQKPGKALQSQLEKQEGQLAPTLEVVTGGSASKTADQSGGDKLTDLSQYTAEEAKGVIAEESDPNVLNQWKKAEDRKTVLQAIDDQLELTKP